MYPLLSVNIPAYDEGQHIAHTINSVLKQNYPGKLEIKVCANGCSDDTEKKVIELAKEYSNIGLLTTRERGKPNAWNILRESANSNYQVFMDGDVLLEHDAIFHLYNHLHKNPNLTAVAAIPIDNPASSSFLNRVVVPPPGIPGGIVGRLYAFDNLKMTKIMHSLSYDFMPKDIIHEDLWLTLILGEGNWGVAEKSKVHGKYPDWRELKDLSYRVVRGHKQIKNDYPELLPKKEPAIEGFFRRYQKVAGTKGFLNKTFAVLAYIHRKGLEKYCSYRIRDEKLKSPLDGWVITKTSKTPFKIQNSF